MIALKDYIVPQSKPSFTRFNVFLRDKFSCQYCGSNEELTFDHLLPRSKGGQTNWDNVVTACSACNVKKGGKLLRQVQELQLIYLKRFKLQVQHPNINNPSNFCVNNWVGSFYHFYANPLLKDDKDID